MCAHHVRWATHACSRTLHRVQVCCKQVLLAAQHMRGWSVTQPPALCELLWGYSTLVMIYKGDEMLAKVSHACIALVQRMPAWGERETRRTMAKTGERKEQARRDFGGLSLQETGQRRRHTPAKAVSDKGSRNGSAGEQKLPGIASSSMAGSGLVRPKDTSKYYGNLVPSHQLISRKAWTHTKFPQGVRQPPWSFLPP